MKDYELSEIDESKLPKVALSDSQKNKIKKALKVSMDRTIESHKDLDIDCSLNNILSIYEELGPEADKTIHYTRHAKVLQKLVMDPFDKKNCPPQDELLYKYFFRIGGNGAGGFGVERSDFPPTWGTNPFYAQVYVTKTHLIVYSFNYIFKVISTYKLPIKDVVNVYHYSIFDDVTNKANHYLYINIESSCYPILSSFTFVDDNFTERKNIDELKAILCNLGIPSVRGPQTLSNKEFAIMIIVIIIFVIISTIGCIQNIHP